MKNIFVIIVSLVSLNLFAQDNNLGLNQIILLELNSSGDIVPSGKIWKVTAAVSTVSTLSQKEESYFLVNDAKSELHQLSWWFNGNPNPNTYNSVNFSSTFSSTTAFPMWLPEGTVLKSGQNVTHLSIVEFNIN